MLDRKRQVPEVVALLVVMAIAMALRLWGISFGLPYTYIPDEPGYVAVALKMLHTGDLNPHWFQVPSLSFQVAGSLPSSCFEHRRSPSPICIGTLSLIPTVCT